MTQHNLTPADPLEKAKTDFNRAVHRLNVATASCDRQQADVHAFDEQISKHLSQATATIEKAVTAYNLQTEQKKQKK